MNRASAKALLMRLAEPRYIARFYPQVWEDGELVDLQPLGPNEWDVTPFMYTLNERTRRLILLDLYSEHSDVLIADPAAPDWVREWEGPYEIAVEERDPSPTEPPGV